MEYKPTFEMILVSNGRVDRFVASIVWAVTDRDFRMAGEGTRRESGISI
jgi:hypothetical protein